MSMVLMAAACFVPQFSHLAKAQDVQSPGESNQNVQNQDAPGDDDPSQDPPSRVARLNVRRVRFPSALPAKMTGSRACPTVPWLRAMTCGLTKIRAPKCMWDRRRSVWREDRHYFLALDDHTTQIRLAQGELIVNARHVDDDDTYECAECCAHFCSRANIALMSAKTEARRLSMYSMAAGASPAVDTHTPWLRGSQRRSAAAISWLTICSNSPVRTISTPGHLIAISRKTTPIRRTMFRAR